MLFEKVESFRVRFGNAQSTASVSLRCHVNNGDDERYPNRFASFSKGLPHDENGIVDPNAYNQMLRAVETGDSRDWDAIPLGSVNGRKLANPQSG